MRVSFDPNKSERNARERGLPFQMADEFDWFSALIVQDVRRDYAEDRFIAYGKIGFRLHVMCFTPIEGGIRVISLRKANEREMKRYENESKAADK